MKYTPLVSLLALLFTSIAHTAEFRIWTSTNGTAIDAQLINFEGNSVNLATKEPRNIRVRTSELSLADRQYLIDYADADEKLLFKADPAVPEHSYRKPQDFITKREENLEFEGVSEPFEVYETAHFVFAATRGVKVTGIAETAESTWHGMAFQHLEFRENWGDRKYLIVLPENEEIYKQLGSYEQQALKANGHGEHAGRIAMTWDRVASAGITAPAEAISSLNLKERGDVFNGRDPKLYRKDFVPFQTHVICSSLFSEQAGGVSSISSTGYFALSTGHAYYKEIQLAKKTETNLIASGGYEGNEIATKSGFDDGTSWARSLRKLVRKGEIKPDLEQILALKGAADLSPETLVTMYSLSCYMQSTQKRIASYAKLIRRVNTSDQVPVPGEFVKFFDFETVEEFEEDWTEFVKSSDFG